MNTSKTTMWVLVAIAVAWFAFNTWQNRQSNTATSSTSQQQAVEEEAPAEPAEPAKPAAPELSVTVDSTSCDANYNQCTAVLTVKNNGREPVSGTVTAVLVGNTGNFASSDTTYNGSGALYTSLNPGTSEYGLFGFDVAYGTVFKQVKVLLNDEQVGSAPVCLTAAYNSAGSTDYC
jgi:hypothetical protein